VIAVSDEVDAVQWVQDATRDEIHWIGNAPTTLILVDGFGIERDGRKVYELDLMTEWDAVLWAACAAVVAEETGAYPSIPRLATDAERAAHKDEVSTRRARDRIGRRDVAQIVGTPNRSPLPS